MKHKTIEKILLVFAIITIVSIFLINKNENRELKIQESKEDNNQFVIYIKDPGDADYKATTLTKWPDGYTYHHSKCVSVTDEGEEVIKNNIEMDSNGKLIFTTDKAELCNLYFDKNTTGSETGGDISTYCILAVGPTGGLQASIIGDSDKIDYYTITYEHSAIPETGIHSIPNTEIKIGEYRCDYHIKDDPSSAYLATGGEVTLKQADSTCASEYATEIIGTNYCYESFHV